MANPDYPIIYKPSAGAYKKWVRNASIPTIILAIGLFVSIVRRVNIYAGIITVVVGAAIGILFSLLYIKQTKVVVTASQIQIKKMFRTISFDRKSVRGLVITNALLSQVTPRAPIAMIYFKSNSSLAKARLNSGFWGQQDLETIAQAINPKNLVTTGMLSPKELVKRHPEFLMFIERGGVFATIITSLVILAAFAVIGFVVWLLYTTS